MVSLTVSSLFFLSSPVKKIVAGGDFQIMLCDVVVVVRKEKGRDFMGLGVV